jgi:hypothetical protein
MRRESFKLCGVIVLCFLAQIFQDAGLGESFPIFRSQNLTSLKNNACDDYTDHKIIHSGMICCLYVYIYVALQEVNTWRLPTLILIFVNILVFFSCVSWLPKYNTLKPRTSFVDNLYFLTVYRSVVCSL